MSLRMRSRSRKGQSTVEYALALSVLVLALVAAAYPFSHDLQCGMQSYSQHFETFYADPSVSGMSPGASQNVSGAPDVGVVCQ